MTTKSGTRSRSVDLESPSRAITMGSLPRSQNGRIPVQPRLPPRNRTPVVPSEADVTRWTIKDMRANDLAESFPFFKCNASNQRIKAIGQGQ